MLIRMLICAYKEACASPLSLGIHKYYIPSVSFRSGLFSYVMYAFMFQVCSSEDHWVSCGAPLS